jgi:hypothetical protein
MNVPKPETVLLPINDPDTLYGIFDGDPAAGKILEELADHARNVARFRQLPLNELGGLAAKSPAPIMGEKPTWR